MRSAHTSFFGNRSCCHCQGSRHYQGGSCVSTLEKLEEFLGQAMAQDGPWCNVAEVEEMACAPTYGADGGKLYAVSYGL